MRDEEVDMANCNCDTYDVGEQVKERDPKKLLRRIHSYIRTSTNDTPQTIHWFKSMIRGMMQGSYEGKD